MGRVRFSLGIAGMMSSTTWTHSFIRQILIQSSLCTPSTKTAWTLPSGSLQSTRGRRHGIKSVQEVALVKGIQTKVLGHVSSGSDAHYGHSINVKRTKWWEMGGDDPTEKVSKENLFIPFLCPLLIWEQSKSFLFLLCLRLGKFPILIMQMMSTNKQEVGSERVLFIFLKGMEIAFRKPNGFFCLSYKSVVWLGEVLTLLQKTVTSDYL